MGKTTDKNQFKVIPNLSLKGPDILRRYQNRTLNLQGQGQYSLDPDIDDARKMTKSDLINKHKELTNQINKAKNNLQHEQ